MTTSWVIIHIATGGVLFETFDKKTADIINTDKYKAVPIREYLSSLNDPEHEHGSYTQ
jgi:hypothetical protein